MSLNPIAANSVLYEAQVRTANACNVTVGNPAQLAACQKKSAPSVVYRAQGMQCDPNTMAGFNQIKLGTLDDMMKDTDDPKDAISLRYIHQRVGANFLWIMPPYPNNDTWNIPDPCDNLGSPYSVRDYMHISGMISNRCIGLGKDEHDPTNPCWGNPEFDSLIGTAANLDGPGQPGLKIMLDIAFNHFGHNYQMYDYAKFTPIQDIVDAGQDPTTLWNENNPSAGFDATYDDNLLHPTLLDSESQLESLAATDAYTQTHLAAFKAKCPSLQGLALVRGYTMWQNALDWERANFQCQDTFLEFQDPGFYLGSDSWNPSQHIGDNFTNNWTDVKFLFHHQDNVAHQYEFVREREYLFRILNYWVSRGVAGFRFDHSTDPNGGMGPDEWKYILSKVDYYAAKRGQNIPIYMAEEFGDQMGMSHVIDMMTDGYIGNMRGGNPKNATFVQNVIDNNSRFDGHTLVMAALEDHDESRLVNGTGFTIFDGTNWGSGEGFWGIGATEWATPMLLIGQEFGESYGLGFKRSDYIRARFENNPNYIGDNRFYQLIDYYGSMIKGRLADENRALRAPMENSLYLPLQSDPGATPDQSVFAMARWSGDGNVVFAFHNLWPVNVEERYYIPEPQKSQMAINDATTYRLVDILSGQQVSCYKGADLAWSFTVIMGAGTRAQWLRLEEANPAQCPQ